MLPACSSDTLTIVLPQKECHAADTGHDTPTGYPSQYTEPTCSCAFH